MAILNLLWWVYCQQWVSTLKINSSANVFSFFRLDNNWLPIRLNTKWPMAQLFKGRHRNSNMEFLNIAQIFEQCPNFFEHCSKDLWFKGALPLQFIPQKIFFFDLFLFFHYYYHFQCSKMRLKNTPRKIGQMFKKKGGGGQRPFEQCSKKLHFFEMGASLREMERLRWL